MPATAKSSGAASYEVRVENKGNREVGVALVASDPDEALRLVLDDTPHAIPPGGTLRARLKATPRSGLALGAAERRSFQVNVMSEGVPAASAGATLVQTARFPGWVPVAARSPVGSRCSRSPGSRSGFLPPGGNASPSAEGLVPSGGPSAAVSVAPSQEAVSAGAGEPSPTPSEEPPSEEPTPTPSEEPTPTPTLRPDLCAEGYDWRRDPPE